MERVPDHPAIRNAERYGYAHLPKAICTCSECGEPIYEGESAYNLPKWGWVCEVCIRDAYKVAE